MMSLKLHGTIEIDEAVITGKRKYHRGRIINRLYWVFGFYSRMERIAYTFLVEDRTTDSLLPIIKM